MTLAGTGLGNHVVNLKDGLWNFDFNVINPILRSFLYWHAVSRSYRMEEIIDKEGGSIFGYNIKRYEINVDYDRVNSYVNNNLSDFSNEWIKRNFISSTTGENVLSGLLTMATQSDSIKRRFHEDCNACIRTSMKNINTESNRLDTQRKVSENTRDLSKATVSILAAFVPGGAGLTAAALKGSIDLAGNLAAQISRGEAASAAISTSNKYFYAELMLGVAKDLTEKSSDTVKNTIIVFSAAHKGWGAHIQGKDLPDCFIDAFAEAISSKIGSKFSANEKSKEYLKGLLKNKNIPLVSNHLGNFDLKDDGYADISKKFISSSTKEITKPIAKFAGGKAKEFIKDDKSTIRYSAVYITDNNHIRNMVTKGIYKVDR